MNADFFQQFKADLSDEAMIILDKAIEALRNEDRGDRFLEETFRGFLLDTPEVADAARPIEYDLFKAIWNAQRRPRAALVKLLFEGVKEDMFYHLRTASRRFNTPAENTISSFLQEMHRQYNQRFGELFAIEVHEIPMVRFVENPLTGEVTSVSYTYSSPTRMTIEYDSNAISQIDVLRENGVSGATYARDFLAKTVNVLNLLSTLFFLWQDWGHAKQERDFEAYFNVTKDLVSAVDDIMHLLPSRHYEGVTARPGWAAFGSGLSFIFNVISLSAMIDGTWDRHASGDYRSAGFMALSVSAATVTLGAEALVLLGAGAATSGPLAILMIGGTLLSVGFGLIGQVLASPEVVIDFRHTYFGTDYPGLESQYDRLSDADKDDVVQLFRRNRRFSWVRNVPRQIGHLNRYFEGAYANLTNQTVRDTTTGREIKEIGIDITNVRCEKYSRVYFELFSEGAVHFGTIGTFIITPEAVQSRAWQAGEPAFVYRITPLSKGRAEISIRMPVALDSPFANVNRAVVGITFQRALEYAHPDDPLGLVGSLRNMPFSVPLHKPIFERTVGKFMSFLEVR